MGLNKSWKLDLSLLVLIVCWKRSLHKILALENATGENFKALSNLI
jgi:hypothetical protein